MNQIRTNDVNVLETISYLHRRDCPSKLTYVNLNMNTEDGRNIPLRNRKKSWNRVQNFVTTATIPSRYAFLLQTFEWLFVRGNHLVACQFAATRRGGWRCHVVEKKENNLKREPKCDKAGREKSFSISNWENDIFLCRIKLPQIKEERTNFIVQLNLSLGSG